MGGWVGGSMGVDCYAYCLGRHVHFYMCVYVCVCAYAYLLGVVQLAVAHILLQLLGPAFTFNESIYIYIYRISRKRKKTIKSMHIQSQLERHNIHLSSHARVQRPLDGRHVVLDIGAVVLRRRFHLLHLLVPLYMYKRSSLIEWGGADGGMHV